MSSAAVEALGASGAPAAVRARETPAPTSPAPAAPGGRTAVNQELDPSRRSVEAQRFEAEMFSRVVGQDVAVESFAEMYQMYLAGFHQPGRPVGNLMFLGPTGTGKTRVWEAAAEVLYGDPRALIRIDCAEFQHSHEIAKLVGSPPGYLGHRETHPVLTQAALDQWHTDQLKLTLVLFDEIEKASDALWQLMLGILDKATLTLGDNSRVNFSRCFIGMTSNLGGVDIVALQEGHRMGFKGADPVVFDRKLSKKVADTAKRAARKKFTPEFMGRIDKVVVFNTLEEKHLRRVLDIELAALQQRIWFAVSGKQFVFEPSPEARRALLTEGTDPKYGARHLKKAVDRNLVFPMANLCSTGQIQAGDKVRVGYEGDYPTGRYVFHKTGENILIPGLGQAPCALPDAAAAAAGTAAPQGPRQSTARRRTRYDDGAK